MLEIPSHFFLIPYNHSAFPGAPGVSDLSGGANCQLFAYEILKYFGKNLPAFRSSELWEDATYTIRVETFEPLDLLLYNSEKKSWGAHVALYLGEGKIIHLSRANGFAKICAHQDLLGLLTYSHFIGAKRIKNLYPAQ